MVLIFKFTMESYQRGTSFESEVRTVLQQYVVKSLPKIPIKTYWKKTDQNHPIY